MAADTWDVAIVGGGPAGSACAAVCAGAGLRTLVLERAKFPREKVCGDCLNPHALPTLQRLGVALHSGHVPRATLRAVEFLGPGQRAPIVVPLPPGDPVELGIRRSVLDAILLGHAAARGATVRDGVAVQKLARAPDDAGWLLQTEAGDVHCRTLVAADGRNGTILRQLGRTARPRSTRVGLQTHLALPSDLHERVRMEFLPGGYGGIADVGEGAANLCMVVEARALDEGKAWAARRYGLPASQPWRTIAPIDRAALPPIVRGVLLVGDTARVVEPFTGEGIGFALLTAEQAGLAVAAERPDTYAAAHRRLYRGRLWVNRLARWCAVSPTLTGLLLRCAAREPRILEALTRKVVSGGAPASLL